MAGKGRHLLEGSLGGGFAVRSDIEDRRQEAEDRVMLDDDLFIVHRSSLSMNDRPLVNRAFGGTTNRDGQ
jgi:hypothetical protein